MSDAAGLIRRARQESGLTQVELARRASTSQPALARYETGATTPGLPTLERLLVACGRRLDLRAPAAKATPIAATSVRAQLGPLARQLRVRRRQLLDSARRRGIRNVRVFGSIARGEAGESSDVDLLVDLDPGRTLLDLIAFRREAEGILERAVDVATPDMLKERIRKEAMSEALPL